MIWSSLARNRSSDPVVLCFFGRVAPSDADRKSRFAPGGNPENKIARFRCPKHQNLAISKQPAKRIATLTQSLNRSSRTTKKTAPYPLRPRLGAGPPLLLALRAATRSMRSAISLLLIDPPHTHENSASSSLERSKNRCASPTLSPVKPASRRTLSLPRARMPN